MCSPLARRENAKNSMIRGAGVCHRFVKLRLHLGDNWVAGVVWGEIIRLSSQFMNSRSSCWCERGFHPTEHQIRID